MAAQARLASTMNARDRRDKFAAAALTGILAAWTGEVQPNPDEAASVAFIFADAMLEESEK